MRASRLAPAAITTAVLLLPVPAFGQEPAKPAPRCGLNLADAPGDTTSQVPTQARPRPAALDITRAFFDHEPGRFGGATTVNIRVADLSTTLPAGATSLNWTAEWLSPTGRVRFVRAVVDYTGATLFEFGEKVPGTDTPVASNVLPRYEPRGHTTGRLFTGPEGVVQIAIPDTWDGVRGTRLTEIFAQSSEGRQVVPNALTTPSRGLSFPADRVPDVETAKWQVADGTCPPATAGA